MRTSAGFFKTVPCKIKNPHIEVNGTLFQVYSWRDHSQFRILFVFLVIIGIPALTCLAFYSAIFIAHSAVVSKDLVGIFLYTSILTLAIVSSIAIIIVSYKMLTKYRGFWIANGTKTIYIEKTDDEIIESRLLELKSKIQSLKLEGSEKALNKKNNLLMFVFFILGFLFIIVPLPLPEIYASMFPVICFLIGGFFKLKIIWDEATWK